MEFKQFKTKCEEKESQLVKECSKKIELYKQESDSAKTKVEGLALNLEKLLNNNELSKKNHQKELSDYVKE